MTSHVLIFGGTGFFGRLLIDDLIRHVNCELILASRRPLQSERYKTVIADLGDPGSLERALVGIDIGICAAGPYQELPTFLAEICVRRRIHYIDLADNRAFVRSVRALTAETETTSAVCTGWSTVSALSGLLMSIASRGMTT